MARRISVWGPRAEFSHSVPLKFELWPLDVRFVESGFFVASLRKRGGFPSTIGQRATDSIAVVLLGLDGDSISHLGTYAGGDLFAVRPPDGRGRMMMTALPFDPRPQLLYGRTGYYHGGAATWELQRYGCRLT
jgi:hypothetical protein